MKEALKEAAKDFLKTECSIYPSDSKMLAHKAFISGAEWLLNSVWHDARKKVPEEKKFCIYILSDGTFGCGYYHKEDNSIWYSRFTDIVKWAYVEDIVPKGGLRK